MLFGSHKRLASSDFGSMLSAGTIHFEERFCARLSGGKGLVSGWDAVHMAAALAGCRVSKNANQKMYP